VAARRISRSTSALVLVAFFLAPIVSAQPQRTREHWVTTWMTSPQAGNWVDTFHDQTVRMIAHVSIGGTRIRVEFSNALGNNSLELGSAHVAIAGQGSAIVPDSDRVLTFGGSASVTIPPGALEVSDPVDLQVPPLSNLAISVFVPDKTVPATKHFLGLHTTYVSGTGDLTADANMSAKSTTSSYYWLSAIDVQASAKTKAIVAFGDSITDGYASTLNANMQWPSQLAGRLHANEKTANVAVLNAGIGGNRVLHDARAFGPNALARFDRDVLGRDGVKYVIVLESINDLGFPHQPDAHGTQEVTAEQLIAGLQQIITRAHAHGMQVFGGTLTPYEGANYYSAEGERKREAVNNWIRTSGAFDGVIDFDAAVRDPQNPLQFLSTYDSGDHLHPNDAGYKAMADAIKLSLFR
jgi:lysophospholipase L1-like esterase